MPKLNREILPHLIEHSICPFKSTELEHLIDHCEKRDELLAQLSSYTFEDAKAQNVYEKIYEHLSIYYSFHNDIENVKALGKRFDMGGVAFVNYDVALFSRFDFVFDGLVLTTKKENKRTLHYYKYPKQLYKALNSHIQFDERRIWHDHYENQMRYILDEFAHEEIKRESFVSTSSPLILGGYQLSNEEVANLHLLQCIAKNYPNKQLSMIDYVENKEKRDLANKLHKTLSQKEDKSRHKI